MCRVPIEKKQTDFIDLRNRATSVLQEEESLQEIVRLVGEESLSDQDRAVLDTAKMIREDFLQQHAFDPEETYTPIKQQYRMLRAIMNFYDTAVQALNEGADFTVVINAKVRERIARMKYIKEDNLGSFNEIEKDIKEQLKKPASDEEKKEQGE